MTITASKECRCVDYFGVAKDVCPQCRGSGVVTTQHQQGEVTMVRAKFEVTGNDGTSISMMPVYSGSEENKKFFSATPGGSISLSILNPDAAKYFEAGKQYYIDFTKAE